MARTRTIEFMRTWARKAVHRMGLATRNDVLRARAELGDELEQLTPRVDWVGTRLDALEEREGWHEKELEELKSRLAIEAVTRWIRQATLRDQPLISVVLPTRDRPELLARAIESVRAQRYGNWELIVVDDHGTQDSQAVAKSFSDPRIRWFPSSGLGEAATRNHGLELAGGELVAYLDDDNVMDADWLYAVAWAFEQRPELDVVYGAYVVDDYRRLKGRDSGALPWTFFTPWDRDLLKKANLTDQSALAHRRELPAAHFDETLKAAADWDLLIRLTADKDPLALPVVACYYTTDAANRMSLAPAFDQQTAVVAARAAAESDRTAH